MSEPTESDGSAPEDTASADRPASYEQARDELADVVRRLETGGLTLEESLALWERGERLADACQAWLDGARQTLDAAMARRAGDGGD
jgi:exodeoxyribonuclease VII small subunit